MKKEQILLLAIGYFASHPSVNEFHVTSDGQHFIDVNNANAHAANLKNKEVSIVTRAEAAEAEKAQANKKDAGGDAKPLSEMTKKELLEQMAERGLKEEKGSTNADKVKAIEDFDAANIRHVVTEQTLTDNPELAEAGVKVGDTIWLPKEEA